jgi:hypothetical protein
MKPEKDTRCNKNLMQCAIEVPAVTLGFQEVAMGNYERRPPGNVMRMGMRTKHPVSVSVPKP